MRPRSAPPPTVYRVPYTPHAGGQLAFHLAGRDHRVRTIASGRKWGKTLAAAADLLAWAVEHPDDTAAIVAPYASLLQTARGVLLQLCFNAGIPWLENKSEGWLDIMPHQLNTRVYLKSADNEVGLRSANLGRLWIDEAAFVSLSAWEAIYPATSQKRGGIVLTSTPNATDPVFWANWARGMNKEPGFWSCQHPSTDSPFFPASELAEARRTMCERAIRQEYMAEFSASGNRVFTNWRSCIVEGRLSGPEAGHVYALGCDLALRADYTVLTAIDQATGRLAGAERFQAPSWDRTRQRVKAFAARFPGPMTIDRSGCGDANVETLAAEGVNLRPFVFTHSSKNRIVDDLAGAFDRAQLAIPRGALEAPETEFIARELDSFAFKRSEAGNIIYAAPEGQTDDFCMALALAQYGRRACAPFERCTGWDSTQADAGAFRDREKLPGAEPAWCRQARERLMRPHKLIGA
jgi:hypothetical protein